MNVITSRLPAERRLPRLGVLNGVLGAALIGAGVASYYAVAGTSAPAAQVRCDRHGPKPMSACAS